MELCIIEVAVNDNKSITFKGSQMLLEGFEYKAFEKDLTERSFIGLLFINKLLLILQIT